MLGLPELLVSLILRGAAPCIINLIQLVLWLHVLQQGVAQVEEEFSANVWDLYQPSIVRNLGCY